MNLLNADFFSPIKDTRKQLNIYQQLCKQAWNGTRRSALSLLQSLKPTREVTNDKSIQWLVAVKLMVKEITALSSRSLSGP